MSQERVRVRLMASLRERRFPQAILIDGPVGIGKKALALEIARALQCTDPNMRPCGKCFGCKMAVDAGVTDNWIFPMTGEESGAKSADEASSRSKAKTVQDYKRDYISQIIENPYRIDVFPAGTVISVNQIRSMMGEFSLKGDRVRVVIIAEADRMNESASNAFLKTLEEVPPDTYFILTTYSREKLLQTIRSRCLSLHLLPLTDAEVREEASRMLSDDSLVSQDVVGVAQGSPGKALLYAPCMEAYGELAAKFVMGSLLKEYGKLFANLEEAELKDAAHANGFLEILSFLLVDLIRGFSHSQLRLPNVTGRVDLSAFPRVDVTALEKALEQVQESIARIESRRSPVDMVMQSLSIKLFEGYR